MKERYIKNSLRKRILGVIGIAVVLTALSAVASAIPFQVGDVFVGVGDGLIKQFSPTGVLKNTLNIGTACAEDSGMAFDSNGNLYATGGFGICTGGKVVKFDNSGTLIIPNFGSGYTSSTESVVLDAATPQHVYIGQPDGLHQLLEFDSSAPQPSAPLAIFTPAIDNRGTDWNDLASDQCTMYYTSESTNVKRFNVCTNTQLPNFNTASLPNTAYALRILPTGEVIVADSDRVILLDAVGNLEKTYAGPSGLVPPLFALNLDPDGTHFWTASFSSGIVYKYDFSNTAGPVFQFDPIKVGNAVSGLAIFGEQTVALGSISGEKFNDLNGNGIKDAGEPGLPNWQIVLTKPDGTKITQNTDASGNYDFGSLTTGTYTVSEVLQPGWKQTFPAGGTYTISITPADHETGKDFGNTNVGSIAGIKFDDFNGNGILDQGEPGLPDWTIVLTKLDGTPVATTPTDANGNYKFDNLVADTYIVGEVLVNGYIQTAPGISETGSATYTVELKAGDKIEGKNFGNFKFGEVHGQKFEDLNANGKLDPNLGETGLAGWNITINGTDTITGKVVTQTTTTDANGNYQFTNLTNGTYTISETSKNGWVQTAPATGTYVVDISSGAVINNQDFGNFHKGKITGIGWIPSGDQKATFGLVGQYPAGSDTAQGNVEVQDQSASLNIKSIQINTVATTLDKKKGVITGLAKVNGAGSYYFEVYVEDNGEPGIGVDVFKISLPTYPYSIGPATLSGGNVQIHQ